jgi:hypothetical protein
MAPRGRPRKKAVEPVEAPQVPDVREVFNSIVPVPETTLERVYRENHVTQELINKQPRYSQMLEQMPGGFEVVVEYLRGIGEPDAEKFFEVYDRVRPDDRDFMGFEGFCAAAGVSGKKLFGILVAEAAMVSENQVSLITALRTPDVINKTFELAKDPLGHRERALIAKASGWLPRPKGSQTNISINTGRINSPQNTVVLPSFEQDIRDLGESFQKGLSSPAPPPKMLEGDRD